MKRNRRFTSISAGLCALLAAGLPGWADVRVELLSGYAFAPGDAANGHSQPAFLTPDGRYQAITSRASNLVPGFVDANRTDDALVLDRQTGIYEYVALPAGTADRTPGRGSSAIALSDDARWALIASYSQDLLTGVTYSSNSIRQLYLVDRQDRVTRLVSHVPGQPLVASADREAEAIKLSSDGRFVLFESRSLNMVTGSTLNVNRVFLYDRLDGETRLLFPASSDGEGAGISADGSLALVGSGGNVYIYQPASGDLELISHIAGDPATPAGGSAPIDLSPDGRFVLFSSSSTSMVSGLVDGNTTSWPDAFVYDRQAGAAIVVSRSVADPLRTANGRSDAHRISDDGNTVYFTSNASNLVAPFTNGNGSASDFYRFDRPSGVVSLISRSTASASQGANAGIEVAESWQTISPDGRYLVYQTEATDLEAGVTDTNGEADLYLFDRDSGSSTLVSRRGGTLLAQTAQPEGALVEANGTVHFASERPLDPTAVDPRTAHDIFVFEQGTGEVSLVTRASLAGWSSWPDGYDVDAGIFTPNGRYAAFSSSLWDGLAGSFERMGHAAGSPGTPANGTTTVTALSPDGRFVGLASTASNLVAGVTDGNGQADAFFYDRNVDTAFLLSHVSGDPSRTATLGGAATVAAMSPDARYFFFGSKGSDLVAGQSGQDAEPDLFVYNRPSSGAELISHSHLASTMTGQPGSAAFKAVSADQRHVLFSSGAHDVIPGFVDHNDYIYDDLQGRGEQPEGFYFRIHDLYYYDRALRQATLISHLPGLPNEGMAGREPGKTFLTADTSAVFYTTWQVAQYQENHNPRAVRWDRASNTNQLLTQMGGGPVAPCTDDASVEDVTADGRLVLLSTRCAFVAGDTNESDDAYLLDTLAGHYVLISHQAGAPAIAAGGWGADLSADGRRVTYAAADRALYSYDRTTGAAARLTSAYYDRAVPAPATVVAASDDGNRLLVTTESPLLVPFDSNSYQDLFVVTRGDVFADGFESGSTAAWSQVLP